jgi:hypothetical protein
MDRATMQGTWPYQHLQEQGWKVRAMDKGTLSEELAEMLDETENMLEKNITDYLAKIQFSY